MCLCAYHHELFSDPEVQNKLGLLSNEELWDMRDKEQKCRLKDTTNESLQSRDSTYKGRANCSYPANLLGYGFPGSCHSLSTPEVAGLTIQRERERESAGCLVSPLIFVVFVVFLYGCVFGKRGGVKQQLFLI